MKAKWIHHHSEWIPGDFEAPSQLAGDDYLSVSRIHRSPSQDLIGTKLYSAGTGIWNTSGKLLHYFESGADLSWERKSATLLSLENQFGPCSQEEGIRHVLKRLDGSPPFHIREEMEICVPTGGVEYLVCNHQGDMGLATWLDQTEWGYVLINLRMMSQLSGRYSYPSATLSPPAFSLDDRFIVSCNYFQDGWWTDEVDDYWDSPSPGGRRKVGSISVHDIASGSITYHDVMVELPSGWIPDRPCEPEWNMIWGPEFVSEREFQIWLPDQSTELLTLPLPPCIDIKRGLKTERKWLE